MPRYTYKLCLLLIRRLSRSFSRDQFGLLRVIFSSLTSLDVSSVFVPGTEILTPSVDPSESDDAFLLDCNASVGAPPPPQPVVCQVSHRVIQPPTAAWASFPSGGLFSLDLTARSVSPAVRSGLSRPLGPASPLSCLSRLTLELLTLARATSAHLGSFPPPSPRCSCQASKPRALASLAALCYPAIALSRLDSDPAPACSTGQGYPLQLLCYQTPSFQALFSVSSTPCIPISTRAFCCSSFLIGRVFR